MGRYVDGVVVQDLPSNEFKRGHFSKVPLMTNRDGYEGYNYRNKNTSTMAEVQSSFQALFPSATPTFFKRLFELYPASNYNSSFFQSAFIFGDFIIDCPTYYMASAVSDYQPVWKMIFDAGTQLHGADKDFLFNTTFGDKSGQNRTLANIMKDYYLSFTTHMDPNAVKYIGTPKPMWPTYVNNASDAFTVMSVNYTEIGAVQDADTSALCDFWHGQSYIVRN